MGAGGEGILAICGRSQPPGNAHAMLLGGAGDVLCLASEPPGDAHAWLLSARAMLIFLLLSRPAIEAS